MSKLYNTAQGKRVNIDNLLLQNEHVIAVGNQKVNARGDQLGPGGKIVKTRDQVMREYYALNTPVAEDITPNPQPATADIVTRAAPVQVKVPVIEQPVVVVAPVVVTAPVVPDLNSGLDEADMGEPEVVAVEAIAVQEVVTAPASGAVPPQPPAPAMRGSLASSIAGAKVVTQTEHLPPKKANGIQRF